MVLVKFYSNYADEFDCEGFALYESMEEFKRSLLITWIMGHDGDWNRKTYENLSMKELEEMASKTLGEDFEMGFGTNEELFFENFNDFENSFSCREITSIEAEIIKKYFDSKYGLFPYLE